MPDPIYSTETPGLVWVKRISYLLDEQFKIPGTKFRFGFDPLINLFPLLGDMTGFFVSAGLVLTMVNKGASRKVVILMCINIVVDAAIGAIPLIGQVFDFFFKANTRNLKLMREHYLEGKHQGSGKGTLIFAVVILLVIMVLLMLALWKIAEWIVGWFA